MTLGFDDLSGGRQGLRFALEDATGLPIRFEDFSVETTSPWVSYRIASEGSEIVVRPTVRHCLCAVWAFGIPHEATVVYRGYGETRASGRVALSPTAPELWSSCGFCIGILVAAIWLIGAAVTYARAPRFPKNSFAEIRRPHQPIRAVEPLRAWTREGNWRCVRGALFVWRIRPARCSIEGLHLEAAYGGFRLLLATSNELIKVDSRGSTIRTLREEAGHRDVLGLPWNSSFSERRSFEQLVVRVG